MLFTGGRGMMNDDYDYYYYISNNSTTFIHQVNTKFNIKLLTNALLISLRTSSTNFVSSLADKMASREKRWMVGISLAGWPSRTILEAPFAANFSTRLSTAMFDGAQAKTYHIYTQMQPPFTLKVVPKTVTLNINNLSSIKYQSILLQNWSF